MKNKLFYVSAAAMGLSLLFNIIYDFVYFFVYPYGPANTDVESSIGIIIGWFFTALALIALIIGLIIKNKILITSYFGFKVLYSLISAFSDIINCFNNNITYSITFVFSDFAAAAFNISMLILVLAAFVQENSSKPGKTKKVNNNNTFQLNYAPQQNFTPQQDFTPQQNNTPIQDSTPQHDYTSQQNSMPLEKRDEILIRYKKLLDAGVISQEEFDIKKKELL